MSHELRTPLNSVIALSGVLSRRMAGKIPAEEYGYLDIIERNGRHLLTLINDILDLSRIEAGREEVDAQPFSLRSLVVEIVDLIAPQAGEKGVALRHEVPADLPPVVSDPDKCRHILQNLVGNAVKFTETGSVEISALRARDEIQIAVRDTGIGIAAKDLDHIFEEFRQADDSAARKFGGTGLGLAIARKYANLLHGRIMVESTSGLGSIFTLTLPLHLGPPFDEALSASAVAPASRLTRAVHGEAVTPTGQRILVVEDNPSAVIQITDILAGSGYRVKAARNGQDALAIIRNAKPDAVILDLMMPEMDGFAVLRTIRESEQGARLPVLILTAKHVTRQELNFLKGNNIHQLIQKGDIGKQELLRSVAGMVAPVAEKPARPVSSPADKPSTGKPVVLIVEDNPDNLKTLRAVIEKDYTIVEAADGGQAIDQVRQYPPDLILMDIALPGMDGFAALSEIRKHVAPGSHVPIVAVTARAMKGDREEILARGFDGYLSKPVDAGLLQRTIEDFLDGKQ